MLKNNVFESFNLNNSEKYKLSFEDIFLKGLYNIKKLSVKKNFMRYCYFGIKNNFSIKNKN